ncbi:MAG: hypothetical protein ABSA50_07040 [Candidatus Bathyarchaeia archaeon]
MKSRLRMAERELKELQAIKKLLVLQLLNEDIKADAIADLLGMDRADFSRMFPVRKLLKRTQRE